MNFDRVENHIYLPTVVTVQTTKAFRKPFVPQVVLAGQALLKSVMNPDLNGVGWVINQIDYYLTTRDNPFDMRVHGLPPA